MNYYQMPFFLQEPVGNNQFSFAKRKIKRLRVAGLVEQSFREVSQGDFPAFVELDNKGEEQSCLGLKHFIRDGKAVIFDNHNHSYYFFKNFLKENNLNALHFIHVDQHKDMRIPYCSFEEFRGRMTDRAKELESLGYGVNEIHSAGQMRNRAMMDLEELDTFLYTNQVLNVGDFIQPLLLEKRIESLYLIDSKYRMDSFDREILTSEYALDLDLDFFSEEMDYIPWDKKIHFAKELSEQARLVLVAFSPYFISFNRARRALEEIFEGMNL